MKKKIVKRTGGTFDFGDFDGKSIKDLVDAVRELEEDYKGQDILFGYDYDASYLSIKIVRDETDEEYAARIKQEASDSRSMANGSRSAGNTGWNFRERSSR